MNVTIRYAGLCLKGPVRVNNEDNLVCPDGCLPMIHDDLTAFHGSIIPGPGASFAVFDGMGGEVSGETASYLAASEFLRWSKQKDGLKRGEETDVCRSMNRKVIEYSRKHRTQGMGSTAAALCFDQTGAFGFNIGDSRCYRFSEKKLIVMSTDHALNSAVTRRPRLTQYLGIPESEFILEPAVYKAPYRRGDLFLLCTDGLTLMAGPVKIEGILSSSDDLSVKLASLKELVFLRGAGDNVTILLFEINWEPDKEKKEGI